MGHPNIQRDTHHLSVETSFEEQLCDMAMRVLVAHYPDYRWHVVVEEATGMWYVTNQDLSGDWGYRGKVGLVYSASAFEKEVLFAGGGILEYFGATRGRANPDALLVLPQDSAGRVLPAGSSDTKFNKFATFRAK